MCSADLMSPPAIVFLPFPFPLEERAASRARFSAASLSSCSFILVSVYDALAMARSPPSSIGLRRRREGGGGGAALLLFGCATGRRRSILLLLGRPLALRRRGAVDRRRLLPGVGVDHGVVGRVVTILRQGAGPAGRQTKPRLNQRLCRRLRERSSQRSSNAWDVARPGTEVQVR